MKATLKTWQWSAGVVARSPVAVLSLAVASAGWGLAAYQWLWLPESSFLVLLLALVWGIAQVALLGGFIAGSASSTVETARSGISRLNIGSFLRLNRRQLLQSLLFLGASVLLLSVLAWLFEWFNAHAVEVASFLTFRSEQPVSHILIERIFRFIEFLLWVVAAGFLLSFEMQLLVLGWKDALKQSRRTLAQCAFRSSFLTGLASVVVFGNLAYWLAVWHPTVTPGFWDYAQMIFRLGTALVALVFGWLFWLLSLARLNFPPQNTTGSGLAG